MHTIRNRLTVTLLGMLGLCCLLLLPHAAQAQAPVVTFDRVEPAGQDGLGRDVYTAYFNVSGGIMVSGPNYVTEGDLLVGDTDWMSISWVGCGLYGSLPATSPACFNTDPPEQVVVQFWVASGGVTISFPAGQYINYDGSSAAAGPFELVAVSDTTPPTATSVILSSSNATDPGYATTGDTISLALTFDEDVVAPSVTIQGESAAVTGSGSTWAASLVVGPGTTEGLVSFEVSGIEDTAGNAASNVTATTNGSSVIVDRSQPGLAITGVPGTFLPGDVFTVSFDFGEAVTGFDDADVIVTGGTAGPLSGGPALYTATVTPDGNDNVTVSVADGAAIDSAGNPSTAASATALIDSATVASEMIADFLLTRARNLVAHQPGLAGFLSGREGGHFQASVTQGNGEIDLHTGSGPLWLSLSGSDTEHESGRDSAYLLGALGGHVELSPDLIVGATLQFDYASDDLGGGVETSGHGWLAGPYVVARLGDQPLFFEGRLLYGESDNEISPFGTFRDEFSSRRWLAMVAIEGAYEAEGLSYFPRLQLSHTVDRQLAYVDGLSNPVPEQTVRLSELSAGLDFEAPLFAGDADHMLTGGISGIWSRVEGDGAATAFIDDAEGGRARLDLGYLYDAGRGLSVSADVFVDGIGSGAFLTRGVSLSVAMEF